MGTSDELYSQILASGPSPSTLILVLSKMKKEGELTRVMQECLKALEAHPNDIGIRKLLAEAYYKAGLVPQAEAELEKVTAQMTDLASVYKLQAEIYGKQEKAEKALEALRIYVAHRPDDQEALDFLETLKPAGEPPSPIEEVPSLEEVLDTMVAVPEERGLPEIATPTLAEIYYKQGQVREAIKVYEKVVAINPQDENARTRLEEFRAMMAADLEKADQEVDRLREKKERMIAILESWLSNIRESIGSPASA